MLSRGTKVGVKLLYSVQEEALVTVQHDEPLSAGA